ncbi:MAG: ABC transporter permease, partial [Chitinophagales bacterium]
MLKNYLITAWRILKRNPLFSLINILGLALGISCSLLISLWVIDECSVDAFHVKGKELYQVYERNYFDGKVTADYPTQGLLADELKRVVPEIDFSSSMDFASAPGTLSTLATPEKKDKINGSFVGSDFLRMFSFPLIEGRADAALKEPNSIAISRKLAIHFFGSPEKAIGKSLLFETKDPLKVTAVFENPPANSSLQFDFLRCWIDYVKENDWVHNWGNTNPATYIKLKDGASPEKVETKIRHFLDGYQAKNIGFKSDLALQPFPERWLHSTFRNGYVDGGRIEYVKLFTVVAIFILVIACINFMNLATARAAKRAKEVGLRKVIGARRWSLIGQFIAESFLLTAMAFLFALILVIIALPAFNGLTGKMLSIPMSNPVFWCFIFGLLMVTSIVAGSYPALFLSSLRTVKVLKGSLKFSVSTSLFRRVLVIFQFTLTIVLIVSMIVVYRQVDFIRSKNIGYQRENLLYIPIEGELVKNYSAFKEELRRMPEILNVSKMRNSPTVIWHHTGSISWPGKDPNLVVPFADGVVGYDFVSTMKLQMKEGRDFSKDFSGDSAGFLLNESAVDKIGLRDPIGKTMIWGNHPGKVIGIIKDFHFSSMHQAVEPLIVRLDEHWTWGNILVRCKAGRTREAIAGLEKIYKTMNPEFPFSYQFSDEEFSKLYRSEEIVSKLSDYFAALAILISCLGLFGLATFATVQRTKEIGVRKVLGAEVHNIVVMLSKEILGLV